MDNKLWDIGTYVQFTPEDYFGNSIPQSFLGRIFQHVSFDNDTSISYWIKWIDSEPKIRFSNDVIKFVSSTNKNLKRIIVNSPELDIQQDVKSHLQKYIAHWSYEIFGTSKDRVLPNAKHMSEEALEVLDAIQNGTTEEVGQELADVVQLAYDIADRLDLNLDYEIQKKMLIVRNRKWLPPDADGLIKHVKEEVPFSFHEAIKDYSQRHE